MDAPKTMDEIFERKRRVRNRFDNLPLTEKMQIALNLYRSLQVVRDARPTAEASLRPPQKIAARLTRN